MGKVANTTVAIFRDSDMAWVPMPSAAMEAKDQRGNPSPI